MWAYSELIASQLKSKTFFVYMYVVCKGNFKKNYLAEDNWAMSETITTLQNVDNGLRGWKGHFSYRREYFGRWKQRECSFCHTPHRLQVCWQMCCGGFGCYLHFYGSPSRIPAVGLYFIYGWTDCTRNSPTVNCIFSPKHNSNNKKQTTNRYILK